MHPGSGVHGKHGFQQMSELHQFPGAIIGSMQIKNANGDVVYTDPRLAAFFAKNADGK